MKLTREQNETIETLLKYSHFMHIDDSQGFKTPLDAFKNKVYIWVKMGDFSIKTEIQEDSDTKRKSLYIQIMDWKNHRNDANYCSYYDDDMKEITNSSYFKLCKSMIEIEKEKEELKKLIDEKPKLRKTKKL